ncbi:IS1634 family transposase [uncultured Duncaniella sp.]|uniref:IS1634 family transposase n=1 Tax=uncultured Duncaniella sp. TaxID=2768039 RepID=UPI00263BB2B6|nr:IS1634 family transposase [uncultured Duncaniella sp.]
MYLDIRKGKDPRYYIMQGFRKKEGGTSSRVYLKLGKASEIMDKYGCDDAEAWARQKLREVNDSIRDDKASVMVPYNPDMKIETGSWKTVHCGHMVLLPLYNKLGLAQFSAEVGRRHRFRYDFADILRKLVMCRVLFPDSKRATRECLNEFVDAPDFSLDDIYNFLGVLAEEITPLQKSLYEATRNELSRRTGVIYYDCTNYYFEIEKEDSLRRYGRSKEHRPNPIVQMGMFMDADGLPLAFCINPGNTSEQQTLQPLEEILANDFNLSEFVVCTDAGLASIDNRLYNTTEGRNYIVTQSIPQLPGTMKDWALEKKGWKRLGDSDDVTYDISELNLENEKGHLYYRERWFRENRSAVKDYEERLIVTFSPKYALYQRQLRAQHMEKALEMIRRRSEKSRQTQQDPRRLISTVRCTDDGEVAQNTLMSLDTDLIEKEKAMDGLNCVATRLEDSVGDILHVNGFRYEIEHLFRVTKTEFDARPVYLRREDRIRAHFAICFVALLLLKAFQKQVNEGMDEDSRYSSEQIISALAGMKYNVVRGTGYVPAYSATALRSRCCETANLPIDRQIVLNREMRQYVKMLNKG